MTHTGTHEQTRTIVNVISNPHVFPTIGQNVCCEKGFFYQDSQSEEAKWNSAIINLITTVLQDHHICTEAPAEK